jgi:1-aminocyclopropane-1-carboxylate deaminase/D-cysteine desulfhydrase-like pyridoxal-dependent ACC family enzyme
MWRNVVSVARSFDSRLAVKTPVQKHGSVWLKREDLFEIAGIRGGKVRACWVLAERAKGLVTAGSRFSPQANIVAQIAKYKRIPCHIHTPKGTLGAEIQAAVEAGAKLFQWDFGYTSVLRARAAADALAMGWKEVPFGMECAESIEQVREQVFDLPTSIKRIVICVGSGMTLAGMLHGMVDAGLKVPVLGICVGGGMDGKKISATLQQRLDRYAPQNWRMMVSLVRCDLQYEEQAPEIEKWGVEFDPHYEAKCLPYVQSSDLFWVVGIRQHVEVNSKASNLLEN